MSMPKPLTGKLAIVPEEEEIGFDEQGAVTPLELVTPEDRASWREEHLIEMLTSFGMTQAEAELHIAYARELE